MKLLGIKEVISQTSREGNKKVIHNEKVMRLTFLCKHVRFSKLMIQQLLSFGVQKKFKEFPD